ncbi:NETI motif-containing protein [Aquibacillus kalidii]|uniref:NETI motif-containing protein n=1 Tax=Aquibacillus kalidii TaxID=2762597 RepID=UPI001F3DE28B|nr:NETI motif-containing protein [Aquibacillus kalidii]
MTKKKQDKTRMKKQYEVGEQETVDQCIDRIRKEGYTPIRRIEKPIFKEVEQNGDIGYEPVSRTIIFDAVPVKDEQ